MSFSLYYAGSLPWLFYYLFITFGSLFVLLIITGTLWVAGKVCPGQGRVAVQKVPDLLQQRWMLSPATPEQLAQAPGHGGQQEQSSQGGMKGLPEPTREHGKHSVRQFPAPSQTKVETMSEIK